MTRHLDAPVRRSLARGEGVDKELRRIGWAFGGLNVLAAVVISLLVLAATGAIDGLRTDIDRIRDEVRAIDPELADAASRVDTLDELVSRRAADAEATAGGRVAALGKRLEPVGQQIGATRTSVPWRLVDDLRANLVAIEEHSDSIAFRAAVATTGRASQARARLWALGAVTALVSLIVSAHFQHRNSSTLKTLAALRFFDPLTGLLNRTGFEVESRRLLASGDDAVMVMLDLDYFQMVNEIGGLAAGDELLRELATTLEALTTENDVLARIGSNSFALLRSPAVGDDSSLAADMRDALRREAFWASGTRFKPTATFGTADTHDAEGMAFDDLFASCEAALFMAKVRARGSEVSLSVGERTDVRHTMHSATRLPNLIQQGGLGLAFQRIKPLRGGRSRCELLLRPTDPYTGEAIAPIDVIRPAERFGFISDIDRWVVETALNLARSDLLSQFHKIGVNLSGASIGQTDFGAYIIELLDRFPSEAQRISFEITETAVVRDVEAARRFMAEARARGATFAIDDFGVGTASFGELRSLSFETVKIDGRFIDDMTSSPTDIEVVRSVVNVAATLNLTTVAERVETADQAEQLHELGVDYIQGWFGHRPERIDLEATLPDRLRSVGVYRQTA